MNSTIGRTMALISRTDTLCIVSHFPMCPSRSDIKAELVGEFSVDSTYYELSLIPPKLAANVTALSGLTVNLCDAA